MLDDLARVAGGALGAAAGVRSEVEARLREQFERILGQMDLVTREEFDAVQAMAIKAREENETLAERLSALESRLAELEKGARPASRRTSKSGGAGKKTSRSGSPRRGKQSSG
jgi:BMFP domain-containing protein YqiC